MGIFSFLQKKEQITPADKTVTAIVLASGNSSRMGGDGKNKVFSLIAGKPVIAYALEAFENAVSVGKVIVVTRSEDMVQMSDIVIRYGAHKVSLIIRGGDTRFESTMAGLMELSKGTKYVAIHDGARPFISPEKINELVLAAKRVGGAIPVVTSVDTVKRVEGGRIVSTENRENICFAQTPQVFEVEKFFAAISINKDSAYTDDSQYFESAGFEVAAVEGDRRNFKITHSSDLARAEALWTEVSTDA